MSQTTDRTIIDTNVDTIRVLKRGQVNVTTTQVGANPLHKGIATVDITKIQAQVANPKVFAWQLRTGGSGDSNGLRDLPFTEANTNLSVLLSMFFTIEQIVSSGGLRVVFNVQSDVAATYTIYYVVTTLAVSKDSNLLSIQP